MSTRLNVIIVQSPRLTSLQVGVVADIVIQLLGRPGIDVAMVKSLEPDETSTDRLMLTSLENDLAVIDWRPVEQSVASLQQLRVAVTRAPHALDKDAPPAQPGLRKLYGVDLRNGFRAVEVVEALTQLLKQRQVVTVSLGSPKIPIVTSVAPANKTMDTSESSSIETHEPEPSSELQTPAINQHETPATRTLSFSPDERSLDQLIDELNDFR